MIEITAAEIVIGIDTHKDIHAAVAMSGIGARLGATTIPATLAGYRTLQAWEEKGRGVGASDMPARII